MAILSDIRDDERMIYSRCVGEMKIQDFRDYIANVWGTMRCYGYNELFSLVDANWDDFDFSLLFEVAGTAANLPSIDTRCKIAFVAGDDRSRRLTEFYIAAKASMPVESRALESFSNEDDAMAWLRESN